jgi:phenylpropionate dioxygenase-like ring-hydroxylating dioxygenase large terminal subunit
VRPAAASTELLDKGWELKSPWFQRDIPLSFDVLLENMTDPAHVPQSHHGVVVRAMGWFVEHKLENSYSVRNL